MLKVFKNADTMLEAALRREIFVCGHPHCKAFYMYTRSAWTALSLSILGSADRSCFCQRFMVLN